MVTICVAIAQPTGTDTISREDLERGWIANPDGGGFAYITPDNTIEVYKSMDMHSFIDAYTEAHTLHGAQSPFMVHMRIATHGEVKLDTTHPFEVKLAGDGEMWFIHNGIISDVSKHTDADTSDTMAFAKHVLEYLSDDWLDSDVMCDLIDDYIGWSKLVFLTTSPNLNAQLYIINEKSGDWVDDVWYSNNSCQPRPVAVYSSTKWDSTKYDEWRKEWESRNTKDVTVLTPPTGGMDQDSLDEWLKDAARTDYGDVNQFYDPYEMQRAGKEQWDSMVLNAAAYGVECTDCMGITQCYCDDACAWCFKLYYECDCHGPFTSIDEFKQDCAYAEEENNARDERAREDEQLVSEAGVVYNIIYDDDGTFMGVRKAGS